MIVQTIQTPDTTISIFYEAFWEFNTSFANYITCLFN